MALARLLDEIIRWRATMSDDVVVVADGYPSARVPEDSLYGVNVRYAHSSARDAADDVIVQLVQAAAAPGELTVVTSDRGLRQQVADLGAGVEGARRFLDRIADIDARRADRRVLAAFGIDESSFLGRGGEARVFAIDAERVLRLPHPGITVDQLDERRWLLAAIASTRASVARPEVLEHRLIDGRTVVVERRLPGRNAIDALAEEGTDREALIRDHLDVSRSIADLPCPADQFGELIGEDAIKTASFGDWAAARLNVSLRRAGPEFASVDPDALTAALIAALPEPEPAHPRLVHLDAFLGNMLADRNRITAVLDFGSMSIAGPPDLDPLINAAYLDPEITPTAAEEDRSVARAWLRQAGLVSAVEPARRWIAAYWTGAIDDLRVRQWCARVLLDP